MAIFGRRLSRLRARAAATATTPPELQVAAARAAAIPLVSRLQVISQAMKGQEPTAPIISPRQAVSLVSSSVPPARTGPWPGATWTPHYVSPTPLYAAKGAKVPDAVANSIREAEARPAQTGIGPLQPQADGDPSFWKQLMSQGLQRVLGPATTSTRPPQPGVAPRRNGVPAPAPGMPGWLLPAALIGGFLLLRR